MNAFLPLVLSLLILIPASLQAASEQGGSPIPIDPMGTSEPVPWTVHVDAAILRSQPTVNSHVLGRASRGESFSGDLILVKDTDEEWLMAPYKGGNVYISRTNLIRVHPVNRASGDIEIGTEIANRWWGLPLEYEPSDLVNLATDLTVGGGRTFQLRREPARAFSDMVRCASREGVEFRVHSAYRSGSYQKKLYDMNVNRYGRAQRHSAPPGHSEHQLGTTVDITDAAKRHYLKQSFRGTPQGRWLEENAWKFGFIRSYTEENRPLTGYVPEPWHWRYIGKENALEKWLEKHKGKASPPKEF